MSHPTELPPLRPPTGEALRSRSHVVPDELVMSRRRRQPPRKPSQQQPQQTGSPQRPFPPSRQQQQQQQQQQQPQDQRLAWAKQSQQQQLLQQRQRQLSRIRGSGADAEASVSSNNGADDDGANLSQSGDADSDAGDAASIVSAGDDAAAFDAARGSSFQYRSSTAPFAREFMGSTDLLRDVLLQDGGRHEQKSESVDDELTSVHTEAKLLDACLREIVKQIVTKDSSNAHYLTRVQQRYSAIFKRLPLATEMLKQEIETLSKINDHISATLQTFQQKVNAAVAGLAVSRDVVKDIASKHFQATQVDHPEDYIQTPQDVAHELKDLYELQRVRLASKADKLAEERDAWCKAAFDMASTMADSKDLTLLQKLRLHQSTWNSLGLKFTLRLKDDSTRAVRNLKQAETMWKREMSMLYRKLQQDDTSLLAVVKELEEGLDAITHGLEATALDRMPKSKVIARAISTLEHWERALSDVLDSFIGIRLSDLQQRDKQVDSAMDTCIRVVQILNKCFPPLETKHGHKLKTINEDVAALVVSVEERIGVNSAFVNALAFLRNEAERMLVMLRSDKSSDDEKLKKLTAVISIWRLKVDAAREHVSRPYVIKPILSQASDWVLAISMDTMAQCNRLVDEVSDVHRAMARWFIAAQKLICGLKEMTINTLAEQADDVIAHVKHVSKSVMAACGPLASEHKDNYKLLDGIGYESKQWGVQVMVILSRLRLDTTEGIDVDAVFRRNMTVKEAQDAWDALEGHAIVSVDDNGTLVIRDLPDYEQIKRQ
ncbi:hypothetical protein PTSG_06374 [Salpingoeca rosetta]|uniref:Uncharacterized protein n=1 Tax=Salpingoeca rosetta (strain ATCC 50818 / BSB-021) TaxID=946362 RepID=F2UCQ6_SALR5|nr:uncharacterized protein PTSG_06374 [Salpingoeca rosetta]EGD74363.1 hypothetical protein PTSG_06374 [Salpingoeca rosetta]|eukprot:XP_004993263.1 hypothetical protein PTSG_06374 [Salpingoeca rosetta]